MSVLNNVKASSPPAPAAGSGPDAGGAFSQEDCHRPAAARGAADFSTSGRLGNEATFLPAGASTPSREVV